MALLVYHCPNCGGSIRFDSGTQKMTCPYCRAEIDVEALRYMDEGLEQDQAPEAVDWGYEGGGWRPEEQQGMAVYTCRACAGEIFGNETLGASSCPFCGNAVVVASKFSGALRPDLVIPFKLDKDAALAALRRHYTKKKLLPRVFKEKEHLDEVKGVYVPFWLYDADADARAEYEAANIRSWTEGSYRYTETSDYRLIREGRLSYDMLPIDGSKEMDDELMMSIEPFDMEDAVDFQTAYLAGYFANKYDVDAEAGGKRAAGRIRSGIRFQFGHQAAGYHTVKLKSLDVRIKNTKIHYALFPVWILSTNWQGQNYIFAMNGQTGKLTGNLPLDESARSRWRRIIIGLGAAVFFTLIRVIFS